MSMQAQWCASTGYDSVMNDRMDAHDGKAAHLVRLNSKL